MYNPDQIYQLGEHLLRSHAQEQVTHFSFEDDTGDGVRYFHGRKSNSGEGLCDDACDAKKSKMYKTTGL